MIRKLVVLFLVLCINDNCAFVTFKNVSFRAYFTLTLNNEAKLSNSLSRLLPDSSVQKVEFIDQDIPVLYANSLADLEELEELVLENCGIHEIERDAIINVPRLIKLSLKRNKLEEIKEGIFDNLNIYILDLSFNHLTTIHSNAFSYLYKLQYINLSSNKIGHWDRNWFKSSYYLTTIVMINNSLSVLPNYAFKNIADYRQTDVPKNLYFSFNGIKSIEPTTFNGLVYVKDLYLDHNQLQEFDDDLLAGIRVTNLALNNNDIRCLTGVLSNVIKVNVNLHSNPLDCVCLTEIKRWARRNSKNVVLPETDC